MRDVINKNVTEEELLETARVAFAGGYSAVKLYFMLGLPTETPEDVQGIAALAKRVVDEFYAMPDKPKGRGVSVSVSASNFVPKPFTPFQWEPQATREELKEKQALLLHSCPSKKINISFHDIDTSFLEGVFARGDRRLADVIETAWKRGCIFDSWNDHFRFDTWMESFSACGLSPEFYANRRREYGETLPWDHLDYGVSKGYLERENEKAKRAETTANCKIKCAGCGANKLNGGHCDV